MKGWDKRARQVDLDALRREFTESRQLLLERIRDVAVRVGEIADEVVARGACSEAGHPDGWDCGSHEHPSRRVRRARHGRHRGDGHDVERWAKVRRTRRRHKLQRRLQRAQYRWRRRGRIVGGVALAPVRMVMHPLRTVGLLLVIILLATMIPGNQLRYLPGTYDQASCESPAGPLGVRTAAYGATSWMRSVKDMDPITVEQWTAWIGEGYRFVSGLALDAWHGATGGPAPEPSAADREHLAQAQLRTAAGGGCGPCPTTDGGDVVRQASTSSTGVTGDAAVAAAVRTYWSDPAQQLKAVQVALAESEGIPTAVNPEVVVVQGRPNQAHGLFQTLLPLHAARYGGDAWSDPDANARVAHLLYLERGWAPWNASASRHADYLPRAQAALAGTSSAGAATPAAVCAPAAAGATGTASDGPVAAFTNGQAPSDALVQTSLGVAVRKDVAASLEQLQVAFTAANGQPLQATDGYRSYEAQVSVRSRKPELAAVPGTSQHGWGLAVDLSGPVSRFGTPQHEWLKANGPRYGWHHPSWAAAGGRKPEPWHWEALVGNTEAA